ncbi:MAG: hypothetical protein IPJ47_18300 [Anaerolineales bacterium]|nr:hypothetical protein [Anaerolineales bacterium]
MQLPLQPLEGQARSGLKRPGSTASTTASTYTTNAAITSTAGTTGTVITIITVITTVTIIPVVIRKNVLGRLRRTDRVNFSLSSTTIRVQAAIYRITLAVIALTTG